MTAGTLNLYLTTTTTTTLDSQRNRFWRGYANKHSLKIGNPVVNTLDTRKAFQPTTNNLLQISHL